MRLRNVGIILFIAGLAMFIGGAEVGCDYPSESPLSTGQTACIVVNAVIIGGALATFAGIVIFFIALGSRRLG